MLNNEVRSRVHQFVQKYRTELIEDLQKLIRIPSETGNEGEVQKHIQKEMLELGLEVETFIADPEKVRLHPEYTESEVEREVGFNDRPNVVGSLKGSGNGNSLLMFTHVDTVPVGDLSHWKYSPFEGTIENGLMYGRGTADNKSGFGSILSALKVLKKMDLNPEGDITVISVVDEEAGGAGGAVPMVQRGYEADACIYPHALTTGLGPQISCAGGLIFKVKVIGEAAHNLNGQIGVNAIGKAMQIYQALVELDNRRVETVKYEPFERYFAASNMPVRSSNLTPAMINGGEWAYKVPADCEITGTVGFPPTETPEQVKEQIEEAIQKVVEQDEWLAENPPEITWIWETSAAETNPNHSIVKMAKSNIEVVTGKNWDIYGIPTFSDIRFPIIYMNVPTISYGPLGGGLHGADEWLDVEDWLRCVEIHILNILEWCGFNEKQNDINNKNLVRG